LEMEAQKKEDDRDNNFQELKKALVAEVQKKEEDLRLAQQKLIDEQKLLYEQIEKTLQERAMQLEAIWREKNEWSQKKLSEDESQRERIIAEKQNSLINLELKYKTDIDRLEKAYMAKSKQLEDQKERWLNEYEASVQTLESLKTKTVEEAEQMRLAYRDKEEQLNQKMIEKERSFDEYRRSVEQEWPAKLESKVNEIAEKTRKQLAERETELAEARKSMIEEATQLRINFSQKMTELEESFSRKEEDLTRKYLQKEHELSVQTQKAVAEMHAKQMATEKEKANYEALAADAAKRREELEIAKQDIHRRIEQITEEFVRQQSIMDEQMRRLQNEKFELKKELENMAQQIRQRAA